MNMRQPEYHKDYKEHRRQLMGFANGGIVPPGISPYKNNSVTAARKAYQEKYNGGTKMNQSDPQLPETVSDLFPSKWLNASDLAGRTFDLTIAAVEGGMFPIHPNTREKELKAIVYFYRAKKGLILNSTQAQQIAEIARTEQFSKWPGTAVTLAPDTAPNGKPTISIRIAPVVQPTEEPAEEDPPAGTATNDDDQPTENGMFDAIYKDGNPVAVGHRAMFNNYRRAHNEDVPDDFADLKQWVIAQKK